MLQASTEGFYSRFLALVAQSRGITPQRADELGQGRVWDGGAARQLGLVDQFGDLDAAIAWAAEQASLAEGTYDVRYLGDTTPTYDTLLARLVMGDSEADTPTGRDVASVFARREVARLGQVVSDFDRLMMAEGVQARCVECVAIPADSAPSGAGIAQTSWRTLLARFALN